MSLESNHAAAGTTATAERSGVKQEWYKKPVALHFGIAIAVIAIALIINYSFTFNFFWKLLLGGALVWGGAKLKAITQVKLWGNIIRGLGWVIIIVSLLNSGFRQVAEKAVISVDQSLSEMSGSKSGPTGEVFKSILPEKNIISEVDFRRAPEGHTIVTEMTFSTIAVVGLSMSPIELGVFWACPETIRPAKLPFTPYFEVVAGKNTSQNHIKLTKESQQALLENGTMSLTVRFTHIRAHTNPCANLR